MNELIDQELKEDFFIEFIDLSHEVEKYLLLLEQEPENLSYVKKLFRPFHTIKGNAGLIEENEIMQISQLAESVLDEIRQGKQVVTENILDACLKSIDIIKAISTQKEALSLQKEINDNLSNLQNILESFDEVKTSCPVLINQKTISEKDNFKDYQVLVNALKQFSESVDNLRYKRKISEYLPVIFNNLIDIRFLANNLKSDNSNSINLCLIYIISLSIDNDKSYHELKWEIMSFFKQEILSQFLDQILNVFKIIIFECDEKNDIEDVFNNLSTENFFTKEQESKNTINNEKRYFILRFNPKYNPKADEIKMLITLFRHFPYRFALLQKNIISEDYWQYMSLLFDEMPIITKSLWNAVFMLIIED